jgi:hypothetical protein
MQLSSLLPLALLTTLASAAALPAAEPQITNKDWKKREALPMAHAGAFQEKRAAATVGGVRFPRLFPNEFAHANF